MQLLMTCDWIGWMAQAVGTGTIVVFIWWVLWRWLLFLAPGLIGWAITVAMTLRGKGGRGAIGLQFVFALLIAVGAMSHFIFEIREQAGWTMGMTWGSFDPWLATKDLFYSTTFALWGLGIHLAALVISLAIAPWAWRRGERPGGK